MKANNFALRLPQSLYETLREAAKADGVAMNQYLAVALAEKLASRRTAAEFLKERGAGGSATRALEILAKSGRDVAEI